jgi:CheY-like chemotaxis protein
MSHEIRTPMNAILGFAEILKGIETDSKKARYISNICTSGQSLLNLINDILDLSKIEAGKMELQFSAVSVASIFDDMKTIFDLNFSDKGLQFDVFCSEDIPPALVMDATRLRQVLINLLGNALKFTDSGKITLRASVAGTVQKEQSSLSLLLEVEDTGSGISREQQEIIFDAFEQIKNDSTSKFDGSGLGLAICSRFVKMMGGEIRVESKIGEGSSFKVFLPDLEIASGDVFKDEGRKLIDFDTIVFEPATLLIADDINYNREMLSTYLNHWAFNLIYAENGKEALEKAKERLPDLILLDMKMPEMDGYECATILKKGKTTAGIPIIAVTASALKHDEEVISRICDGYLRKPVSKSELVNKLILFLSYRLEERNKKISSAINNAKSTTLSCEVLAALPRAWHANVYEAAQKGQRVVLEDLIREIQGEYLDISNALAHLVRQYRFDTISDLVAEGVNGDADAK